MTKIRILLFAIILFAGIIRFWDLGKNPPSLNWDEVSIGYNAYSIMQTGRDEYGTFLPISFRSLDDYKQPVYPYITIVSEFIFGLTPFAVRFPSAFFGTLTVLILYFLVKELLGNRGIALISSFFLSILPWHVQFSRVAIEANLGLFFLSFAILIFLVGIKRFSLLLPVSALLFMLSIYSYLSFRIVVPLTMSMLFALYFKEVIKKKVSFVLSIFIVLFAISFLFYDTFSQNGLVRLRGNNVFDHYPKIYENVQNEMYYDAKLKINLLRRVFHDTSMPTSLDLIERGYFTHFSPDFLFFYLNQKHHHAPGVGLLYIWMLPFIPLGIYYLFRKNKKSFIFVLSLLLIAPVPASVTWDIPHAIRSVTMLIPLSILSGIGIYYFFSNLFKKRMLIFFALPIFSLIILFSIIFFFHQYFVHLPNEKSQDWVYGREELAKYLKGHEKEYKKIIVSTKLEWHYIFLLFYSGYDPKKYLSSGGTVSGGWGEEKNKFGIYEFHQFDYNQDKVDGDTLYISEPGGFPPGVNRVKTIYYLDGKPAIYLVKKTLK